MASDCQHNHRVNAGRVVRCTDCGAIADPSVFVWSSGQLVTCMVPEHQRIAELERERDELRDEITDIRARFTRSRRDRWHQLKIIRSAYRKYRSKAFRAQCTLNRVWREREEARAERDELRAELAEANRALDQTRDNYDDIHRRCADMTRERDAAIARAEKAERYLLSLLARIHRDGGHETDRLGTEKSVAAAHDKVANAYNDLARERALADRLAAAGDAVADELRLSGGEDPGDCFACERPWNDHHEACTVRQWARAVAEHVAARKAGG